MIRARCEAKDTGLPVIVLGVSKANVNRMLAGDPIRATGASVGIPSLDSVVIFYGETEEAMVALLRSHNLITADTVVVKEPRPPAGNSR